MDEATTARTSAAHAAFSEATTRKATFVATESQIYRPIPTRGLPETTTTALQNTSGWDDPFSGQRESKPWGNFLYLYITGHDVKIIVLKSSYANSFNRL